MYYYFTLCDAFTEIKSYLPLFKFEKHMYEFFFF